MEKEYIDSQSIEDIYYSDRKKKKHILKTFILFAVRQHIILSSTWTP